MNHQVGVGDKIGKFSGIRNPFYSGQVVKMRRLRAWMPTALASLLTYYYRAREWSFFSSSSSIYPYVYYGGSLLYKTEK